MTKKRKAIVQTPPMMLTQKRVREFVKGSTPMHFGEDFFTELNTKLASIVNRAVARCGDNKRKTLKAMDV